MRRTSWIPEPTARAEECAHVVHEAIRALRQVRRGACMMRSWSLISDSQRDLAIQVAEAALMGSYEAWSLHDWYRKAMLGDGWSHGPYSYQARTDPEVCEWEDLDPEQRREWALRLSIVESLALDPEES